MKKIICLLLVILMIASIVSCGTSEETENDTSDMVATDAAETENIKAGAEKYDGVFKVGFARVDITPTQLPHPRKDGTLI